MKRNMGARLGRAAVFLIGLAVLPAVAQERPAIEAPTRTITVVGTGEVAAVPDIARVTIGVVERADSAADAMRANTAQMNRLIAVLDTVGIGPRDRQTASLQINAEYSYPNSGGRSQLEGYTARNTLIIRVKDLATIGDVLDALVEAGANQLDGIAFDVSEPGSLLDEARAAAVADARRKADLLATSAGVTLGPVQSIAEIGYQPMPTPMMRSEVMAAAEAIPVEAGEQTLQVRVTTVWTIEP